MLDLIKLYPYPSLREKTEEVSYITEEILTLGEEMLKTVIEAKAVGISAPQLGKPIKALVIRIEENGQDKVYFAMNPEIINHSNIIIEANEGCLSFPGLAVKVKRYKDITVRYKNSKDEVATLTCSDLLAVAFQHEIDHLNGVLLIDKMSNTSKKRSKGYFKNLEILNKKLNKKLRKMKAAS